MIVTGLSSEIFEKVGEDADFDNREHILGGSYAKSISETPYLVSIQNRGRHLCGGAIITPSHILSAAHCFTKPTNNLTLLTVKAGTHDLDKGGTLHRVKKITSHPGFQQLRTAVYNDLAVVEVNFIYNDLSKNIL